MALRLKDILAERKRAAQLQQGKQVAEIELQPTQPLPPPNYVPHTEQDIWELAGLF